MKKWYIFAIICSFMAGSVMSGSSIFANPDGKGHPFENLQNQIDNIINGNTPIKGESKILFLGNGFADPNGQTSYACVASVQSHPLSSCTRNIPLDGKLTDLTASSMRLGNIESPGQGKFYEIKVVKNGVDTELSCMILNGEAICKNTSDFVPVLAGDRIDLKISGSENSNAANIAGSVLLSP